MSNDGSAKPTPLPRYTQLKANELVEKLVRDFGMENTLELRELAYHTIGEAVCDVLESHRHTHHS